MDGRLGNPVPSPSPLKVLFAGRYATLLGRSVPFGNDSSDRSAYSAD
jgi:hypothetical protein